MTQIKIGGINYSVIKKNNLEDNNEPVWGMVSYENSNIYIRKNLSLQKQRQTIIHEALHAMLHESGLDDYANDEKIVTPLGNVLFEFINDNAQLVRKLNRSNNGTTGENNG